MDETTLGRAATIGWVFAGILISLLLPVAVRALRSGRVGLEANALPPSLGQRLKSAWDRLGGNKYLVIAAAATFVAIVLVFLLGLEFHTVRDATLAGFAWESLVGKLGDRSGT
jgi:hypothetical protein